MELIQFVLASTGSVPTAPTPDSGATGLLLGAAVIGLGIAARYLKGKRK